MVGGCYLLIWDGCLDCFDCWALSKTTFVHVPQTSQKANKMEQIKKSKGDIVYSFCHNNYEAFPSFSRDIYPNEEDVLQSDIIELHKKYIATGENEGQLHIYENNKCK